MKTILIWLAILFEIVSTNLHAQNSPFSVNNQSGQSITNLTSDVAYGAILKFQRFGSSTNYYSFETGAGSNDDLRLYVNGNWSTPISLYRSNGDIIHNGSLGLGTNVINEKLTINGGIGFFGSGLDGSTLQRTVFYSDVTNGLLIEAPLNSSNAKLNMQLNWRGGGEAPFFIKGSDSFVGVGTSNPQWKLHVKGAVTAEGDGAGGYADFNLKNGAQRWHISGPRFGESNRLGFFWYDGSSYYDYLTVSTTGNVGIGTPSPDAKLAVKGTIHTQEVKVDLSVPGPDYVFEENYNLPSLESIKIYIDENKHLPEVPSAKEMETNGVNLGEMNMLLLKKIEELTLYQIETTRKIEQLELEIQQLKTVKN